MIQTGCHDVISRQPFSGIQAFLLILVFFCIPALSRAFDHTSIARETAGFKFSKSLERPHDKVSSVTRLLAEQTTSPPVDTRWVACVRLLETVRICSSVLGSLAPLRAPPCSSL